MSAEVENKEEEKPEPKRPLRLRLLDHWQLGMKLLELILAATCLGFIYEPARTTGMGGSYLHHIGVMYTAYTGCMVTILGFIVGRILREKQGFRTSFVFSTIYSALFLATGILLTADKADLTKDHFFHPARYLLTMMTTAIITTFLNAFVFIVDAILTFKMQQDF